MVVDCELVDKRSKFCHKKDFDFIFVAVDAHEGSSQCHDSHSASSALSTHHCICALSSLRRDCGSRCHVAHCGVWLTVRV